MDSRCEETRALAPELALGVADGEERGRALQHLAECPECRAEVQRLADVADELLLLAPRREAPVGFESRVVDEVLPSSRPRRRRRTRLALVLAPAAAAAAAVAITLGIVSDDLQLASDYRDTLEQANGDGFYSSALRTHGGGEAGTVFTYVGAPSWLFISVDAAHRAGLREAELVMNDGTRVPLHWFRLDGSGSSGGGIPDPHRISVLRLTSSHGEPLLARFGG
jgi:predicted anti-sigma-YlaC factor YlaD